MVRLGSCIFALSCLLPAAASADPVVITSGVLGVGPLGTTELRLEGEGLSVTASGFTRTSATGDCDPCFPGTRLPLTGSFGNTGFSPDLGYGPATYLGATYGNLYFGGELRFVGGEVVLEGTAGIDVLLPFTMTGHLNAYHDPARAMLAFRTAVRGVGMGRIVAGFTPPNEFAPVRYTYTFEDAAPVPEPATLMLVGLGLAGVFRGRLRGRRSE